MPTNLVQNGERIGVTLAANVTAGGLYSLVGGAETGANGLPVIAAKSGVTGAAVEFITEGVFTVTKIAEANSDLDPGDLVYGRTVSGQQHVTGLATAANSIIGTAWAAAVTGATTAQVRLSGKNAGA